MPIRYVLKFLKFKFGSNYDLFLIEPARCTPTLSSGYQFKTTSVENLAGEEVQCPPHTFISYIDSFLTLSHGYTEGFWRYLYRCCPKPDGGPCLQPMRRVWRATNWESFSLADRPIGLPSTQYGNIWMVNNLILHCRHNRGLIMGWKIERHPSRQSLRYVYQCCDVNPGQALVCDNYKVAGGSPLLFNSLLFLANDPPVNCPENRFLAYYRIFVAINGSPIQVVPETGTFLSDQRGTFVYRCCYA